MKHYLTIVQNDSVCACYAYDDKSAAMAAFHTELAYRHESRISTMCVVMNGNGTVVASEKYVAPPAPAPAVEDGEGE